MIAYRLSVALTNETEGHIFADWDEPVEEHLMGDDGRPDFGAIYRAVRSEYGACRSSVYVDTSTGTRRVGWFFVSRQLYQDTGEPYLRGAWVTVFENVPTEVGAG